MAALFTELSLTAQTAYAQVLDTAITSEVEHAVASLSGSFAAKTVKGKRYWYFQYRELNGVVRQIYVGPDAAKVRALVERATAGKSETPVALARSAIALGNQGVLATHFRIIRRLAEYGFFRAGGVLVGTHAFLAHGNLLGARWLEGARTQDIDFAHAGKNVSIALPASIEVDARGAIDSLTMGLLPSSALDGGPGVSFLSPKAPDLRLDFLTTRSRDDRPVRLAQLNVSAQPLRFMEYLLEHPVQAALLGQLGTVVVNVPAPARYGLHKLIVAANRDTKYRTKANKDLLQAAALILYLRQHAPDDLAEAWRDLLRRGPSWRKHATKGREALQVLRPDLRRIDWPK